MSWLSKGLHKIGDALSGNSDAKRQEMQLVKEQIDLYHDQKEQLHKNAEDLAHQKDVEREKINQKQIRSLRRNLRRNTGFINSPSPEVNDTLG